MTVKPSFFHCEGCVLFLRHWSSSWALGALTFSFYHKDCCSEHGNLEPNQNRNLAELVKPWKATLCPASVTQAIALSVSWLCTMYLCRTVFHVFSAFCSCMILSTLVLNGGYLLNFSTFFFFFAVLGSELQVLLMLGKCATHELYFAQVLSFCFETRSQ